MGANIKGVGILLSILDIKNIKKSGISIYSFT